jgi:RecA/RadA recombinase
MAGSDRMVSRTGGDRDKALETALAQIERQFGRGSIMRLGEEGRPPMEVIPTGSIALDVALGIGGLPRGRVVEIYGPEGSGKTTLALHALANAQKAGGIAAFIDAEHALDPEYAKNLGVDTDALLVSQPDTGEQALEIADMLIRSGAVDVIVIDSVAALVPRAEIEGEMGDSHVGLQARLMSQALRKLAGALNQTKTTAIFINQLREKVGVMFGCMSYSTRPWPTARRRRSARSLTSAGMSRCCPTTRTPGAPSRAASSTGSTTARPSASSSSPWPSRVGTGGPSSPRRRTTSSGRPAAGTRQAS